MTRKSQYPGVTTRGKIRRGHRIALREREHACHYCGGVASTWDHIVPASWHGNASRYNLVPACVPCNELKGSRFPVCRCDVCEAAVRSWTRRMLEAGRWGLMLDRHCRRAALRPVPALTRLTPRSLGARLDPEMIDLLRGAA